MIGCVLRPKVSATSRSFHVQRNWKIASEAIAGRPSGRIRRMKIRNSEAPSMRADSRMSFGIPMKKLRSRKIANGSPNAVWKRIEPEHGVEDARGCCRAEDRDQRHLQRHDEQRDHPDEEPVAARELEPGKRIGGERGDDDRRAPSRRSRSPRSSSSECVIGPFWKSCAVVRPTSRGSACEKTSTSPPLSKSRRQDRGDEEAERRDEPEDADDDEEDLHRRLRDDAQDPRRRCRADARRATGAQSSATAAVRPPS